MTDSLRPVRLYAPDRYKDPRLISYAEALFPFWGVAVKDSNPYLKKAEMQYQYSKKDFELTERIEDADFVMLPYQYYRMMQVCPERVEMILGEARAAGKPLFIDGSSDLEPPIPIKDAAIMRISQYRYSISPNEFTIPFAAEDLVESYTGGELQLREKVARPSVGFTGWSSMSLKTRIRTHLKELPTTLLSLVDPKRGAEHKGVLFRERALKALERNQKIETHFKARPTFSGHVKTITGSVDGNRREFVENLLNSDYALAVRGDGNCSIRFYEALSLGRIPVFLDTACVLPLEDRLNYRDFCVFVDWRDVERIGDILADFHAQCSPEKFADMQKKARDAYRHYLRFDAFSGHLADQLRRFIRRA